MELRCRQRTRQADPRSVPWPLADEPGVIAVDTTWGTPQRLQPVPGVRIVGELVVTWTESRLLGFATSQHIGP